jgi:hypothetical protein
MTKERLFRYRGAFYLSNAVIYMTKINKLLEIEGYWRRTRHSYSGHPVSWKEAREEILNGEGEFDPAYVKAIHDALDAGQLFTRFWDPDLEDWTTFLLETFDLWYRLPDRFNVLLMFGRSSNGGSLAIIVKLHQAERLDGLLKKKNTTWLGARSLAADFDALSKERLNKIPYGLRDWVRSASGRLKAQ